MVSAIASRKYERAALSRLFRFTVAIQPTVRAEHRSDGEVTMWPTRCSRPWALHCIATPQAERGQGGSF